MENTKILKDEDKFLQYIGDNFERLRFKYRRFCEDKDLKWDDDLFSDTYLKCYEAIKRKGKLNDTSPIGIENYFFMSFRTNLKREPQYCRNSKRDVNYTDDEIQDMYEEWANDEMDSSINKVRKDLWVDFTAVYLVTKAEMNLDAESVYLFKMKTFTKLTYKQIEEKTKIKGVRNKVIDVRNWLRDNVTKQEVANAFADAYDELM